MKIGGVLLALAMALVPCSACGGRVSSEDGDAGARPDGSATAPPDGHAPQIPALCPADPPQPGDPCLSPGQGCIYVAGSSCEAFVCSASGRWASSQLGC